MTKRLFISVDFPPEIGGIQNYVYGIVSHLDAKDTFVLTSNRVGKNKYLPFDKDQEFKIYRTNVTSSVPLIFQLAQLILLFFLVIRIIKIHKIEEIHFGNVMPVGLIGPILKTLFRIRYYPYIHGLDFLESKVNPLKFKLLKKILQHASKIICNSNYTQSVVKESGFDENRIIVIHPGIPKTNPSLDLNKTETINKYNLKGKFVLITVGRLVKRKGHDKVIQSLKEIIKINKDIKYIVCGNGPERENLEMMVKEGNLENYVTFVGDIERGELETIYSVADLFIMLNREIKETGDVEGYGIVFLEAGIYGLPVIGGNNGGVPDAVLHGETGFLIDSLNDEEIVKTISSFFYDKNLTKTLGENGYKWVNENCLWHHRIKLLETLKG